MNLLFNIKSVFSPLLLFFSALTAPILICAQTLPNLIPPSPEATTLFRNLDYGVNNCFGQAQINIPIYEVKSGNLSVPISISYNTNGRKVFDVTGPVGLGWSLNCGGMISRTIYGKPDDQFSFPYVLKPAATLTNKNDYDYLASLYYKNSSNDYDSEYDIFSYYFGSNSGKFIVEHNYNGTPKVNLLSANSDAISFNSSYTPNSNGAFPSTITNDKGVKYQFDINEINSGASTPYYFTPISGKLLSSITSSDGQDVITFTYVTAIQRSRKYSQEITFIDNDSRNTNPGLVSRSQVNLQDYQEYTIQRLSEINFRNGKIKFITYSNSDRIKTIQVFNKNDEVIRSFEFQSSHLDSPSFATMEGIYKLDNLLLQDNNGVINQKYSFVYNPSVNFNSNDRDSWDYLNYNDISIPRNTTVVQTVEDIYTLSGHNGNSVGNTYRIAGGVRTANSSASSSGVLKRITFPSGGSTEFIYESNRFQWGLSILDGGGLRVAQIISSDNNGNVSTKTYKYGGNESGNGTISNGKIYTSEIGYEKRYFTNLVNQSTATTASYRKRVYSSDFMPAVADLGNDPVSYSQVTEYNGTPENNKGKTVYSYNVYNKYNAENMPSPVFPGYIPSPFQYLSFYSFSFDYDLVQQHIYRYNLWQESKLRSIAIYKNDGKDTYGKIIYTPHKFIGNNYVYTQTGMVKGFHINKFVECGNSDITSPASQGSGGGEAMGARELGLPVFLFDDYEITMGKIELESTTESDYTSGSLITKTTNYTYNNKLLPVTIKTSTSANNNITTTIKYPQDFISDPDPTRSAVSTSMVSANMLNYSIEQSASILKNTVSTLLSSTRTNYKNWGTFIEPETIEKKLGHNSYETRIHYYAYDNKANPLSESKEKDVLIGYIWDYNQSYAIAQVTGATQTDIAYTSFEAAGNGNWTFTGVPIIDYNSLSGNKSYNLSAGYIIKSALDVSKTYIVSYWSRSGAQSVSYSSAPVHGKNVNGWVYYEYNVVNASSVTVSGTGVIDELRLYPTDAQMTTYTYEPLIGMTSQCDINNNLTYYEYDGIGRLKLIRDQNRNILKQLNYNLINPSYFSDVQSSKFNKTGCGPDYLGSQVIYTISEGTYSSNISKDDANTKARADINSKGQTYANDNGICYNYKNSEARKVFIKACSSGLYGSEIEYIVPYGKYTSIISPADAEAKATNDINANGQNYANTLPSGKCYTYSEAFKNDAISTNLKKEDCSIEYTGSSYASNPYVIPYGKYISTVSQYAANNKAGVELVAKQNEVNHAGYCTAIPTVNIQVSNSTHYDVTITFSNSVGYFTYTAISGNFSGTVSVPEGTYTITMNPAPSNSNTFHFYLGGVGKQGTYASYSNVKPASISISN